MFRSSIHVHTKFVTLARISCMQIRILGNGESRRLRDGDEEECRVKPRRKRKDRQSD